ncbi:MAG: radical SAM/SPASM domain-containing protein [Candidatus Scalinduaceae bacterium]
MMVLFSKEIVKGTSKIKRLFDPPTPLRVKRANLAITYLCDSKCQMCNIWQEYRNKPEERENEITFDEIKKMLEESKYLESLDEILLTGGEPFLRNDLYKIFQYITSKYKYAGIVISTNGMLGRRIIETLKKMLELDGASRMILVFSIDGIGEKHDKIRGIKGAFNKTLGTIKLVKELDPSMQLGLSCTITQENYDDFASVYELSKELHVGFTMRFAATSGNFYANKENKYHWPKEVLDKIEEEINKIIDDISNNRNIIKRFFNPDTYFFSRLVDYQKNPRRIFQCYSGIHSFFLDPYGNVYPCIYIDESLGNIRNTPFDEMWFSSKAQRLREFIKNEKCHCWSECEVLPSLQRRIIRR